MHKTQEGTKLTHIYLVYLQEKKPTRIQVTKLKTELKNKMKAKPEQAHTKKERKNETIPETMKQMFIVLRIDNHISQATNH